MTPFACSIHTHSAFCDGENTLAEMANAAFDKNVVYFGASSHSHTPVPWDAGHVLPADTTAYREAVLRLRAEYAGRMEILFGIEWDSQSDFLPEGFDYWIGSVHNLYDPETETYYCVDWDKEKLADCRDRMFHGDALAMAEGYYQEAARVAAMRPTILGHFDLVTKLNGGNKFFDEEAPRYRSAALDALHAADPRATLLEINTGGMARGYRDVPYPALFLLREWKAMGGKIILTADAHSADGIVYGYGQAAALAGAAGFDRSVLLTMAGEAECPL